MTQELRETTRNSQAEPPPAFPPSTARPAPRPATPQAVAPAANAGPDGLASAGDHRRLLMRLREQAIPALARMYRPDERLFVFRLQRSKDGVTPEGLSWRYTAITVIGLAGEDETAARTVLGDDTLLDVCGHLLGDIPRIRNLGDVALILWAACATRYPERRWAWEKLLELDPAGRTHSTVELAWTLSALCLDAEAPVADLRIRLARRLLSAFNPETGMFPHMVGKDAVNPRGHVTCFADLVYPILALSHYHDLTRDPQAAAAARRCAERVCALQGAAGQWWWHYDYRTGDVIERYPVYAVHQDAMAPMALLALQEATGHNVAGPVRRGLQWLMASPELGGKSLIDDEAGITWRKVARREPGKLSRRLQAIAAGLHPSFRVPGLDCIFPAQCVDYEDRPYHLGWLFYAWPRRRIEGLL